MIIKVVLQLSKTFVIFISQLFVKTYYSHDDNYKKYQNFCEVIEMEVTIRQKKKFFLKFKTINDRDFFPRPQAR